MLAVQLLDVEAAWHSKSFLIFFVGWKLNGVDKGIRMHLDAYKALKKRLSFPAPSIPHSAK